jgi:hypothetical protein
MDAHLVAKEAMLRAEADALLASGLRAALESYGEIHVVGSYALQLMVWRDLDIHIVRPDLQPRPFFELGGKLAQLLKPAKMHYRDELVMQTPDLPSGLYWGIYLGDEREDAWKIDIWATDEEGFKSATRHDAWLRPALTDDVRTRILRVKSAVWQDPRYRKSFSSLDVYRAVIENGVGDVEAFHRYLESAK